MTQSDTFVSATLQCSGGEKEGEGCWRQTDRQAGSGAEENAG